MLMPSIFRDNFVDDLFDSFFAAPSRYTLRSQRAVSMNADVKEYWIIDPENKTVQIYEFEKSDFPTTYTFEDKIPVGIFDGECEVDMGEIYEYISFLYEENRENL